MCLTFDKIFQSKTTGQDLLDDIFKYLNLIETHWFGLRYQDNENQTVKKQFSNEDNSSGAIIFLFQRIFSLSIIGLELSCNDRQQQIVILIASNENFMAHSPQSSPTCSKLKCPNGTSTSTMACELFSNFVCSPYLVKLHKCLQSWFAQSTVR